MEAHSQPALGLIETRGRALLTRAVDAALKAARVSLETDHYVGDGLVLATVGGDVGAVRAALDAARAVISSMGGDGMTSVIARPDPAVREMLRRDGRKAPGSGPPPAAPPAVRPKAEVPAVRAVPEVPAVKPESRAPAPRPKAAVPVAKAPAKVPAVRPGPRKKPAGGAKGDGPVETKTAGRGRKPRKPGKK